MKKTTILACFCMALIFCSCHKDQHTYNAAMTESYFANYNNKLSVMTVLNNLSNFWQGDYTWKGDIGWTDVQAETRFTLESVQAININFDNMLAQYFEEDDYFIYTLTRKEDNTILHQYMFSKNGCQDINAQQHTYHTEVEYHFVNHDNEVGVKSILNNLGIFWEDSWTGPIELTDKKANDRFTTESVPNISNNFDNKLAKYFKEGDYFTYSLCRKNPDGFLGYTIIHSYKFTKNGTEEFIPVK